QFESSPQPMWIVDVESLAFLVVNDAAVAHYGYSREDFARMTLANLHSPQDMLQVVESLRSCGSKPQYGIARKHQCKNGQVINVEIASHALDWDGRAARMTLPVVSWLNRLGNGCTKRWIKRWPNAPAS